MTRPFGYMGYCFGGAGLLFVGCWGVVLVCFVQCCISCCVLWYWSMRWCLFLFWLVVSSLVMGLVGMYLVFRYPCCCRVVILWCRCLRWFHSCSSVSCVWSVMVGFPMCRCSGSSVFLWVWFLLSLGVGFLGWGCFLILILVILLFRRCF